MNNQMKNVAPIQCKAIILSRECMMFSACTYLHKEGKNDNVNVIKAHFMCNGFFLSDSNIKLADRKYPSN